MMSIESAAAEAPYTFFFQAEDGIRDVAVTGVQTCALPICRSCKPKAATFRKQLDTAQPRRWCRLLEVPRKQHSAPPQWAGRWQPSRRLGLAARPDQVVCPVLAFAFDQAGIDRSEERRVGKE